MTSLDDLIAQQKAQLEAFETEDLNVAMAGELVPLKISAILPDRWSLVVASNPPRPGAARDKNLGMNTNTLPADYPAASIIVAGEHVTQERWREIYGVLDSVNRENVATVIWGLNVWTPLKKLSDLGKAQRESETKPRSRSRSASPRGAGTAGSRPKSPRSSTTRKAD